MTNLHLYFSASVLYILSNVSYTDSAAPWQITFQDSATPVMEGIIDLHHTIFFFLIIIFAVVMWLFARILTSFSHTKNQWTFKLPNATVVEITWTIVPILILSLMLKPSFSLLYTQDEIIDPAITLKAIGRQWYWTYEYSDYASNDEDSVTFDSYMVQEKNLEEDGLRLLEVDERVVLPTDTHIRVIVTASDVIHCWAVPSLGVKMDGVPGRLNQTTMFIKREGVYHGQCSEICGENHGFMPIVVEAVDTNKYIDWLAEAGDE